MTRTPAIALRRHQDATTKIAHKLSVLEKMISGNELGRFPRNVSITSFASWADDELGVSKISRSVLYESSPEYAALFNRLKAALGRVMLARSAPKRKANEAESLRQKLAEANERAQSYVNQYSMAKAESAEAQREIERLRARVQRLTTAAAKLTPLRQVTDALQPIPGGSGQKNK